MHVILYPTKLDIIFDIKCIEYLNNTYGWEEAPDAAFVEDEGDHYGSTYGLLYNKETMLKTILVVFDGIPNPPQMAHEAFHVANGILKSIDLEFNYSKMLETNT